MVFRRARHVVTENQRVLSFIKALENGTPEKAGQLMNESHHSLRDDFEVSSEALDLISECARESPGCYGARMTGGGFAGCGVALVDPPMRLHTRQILLRSCVRHNIREILGHIR